MCVALWPAIIFILTYFAAGVDVLLSGTADSGVFLPG